MGVENDTDIVIGEQETPVSEPAHQHAPTYCAGDITVPTRARKYINAYPEFPPMAKKLILVVDRDDDYGEKGKVETPVIGVDACIRAATELAVADPEDSDVNALFAAINFYKERMAEDNPKDTFEVALICGASRVGYESDQALVHELEMVLDQVRPDSVVLVSDGAEDEYVYPVIASRVPIDNKRKVFVKQAPGVEGTLYILGKYMKDPDKKQRFIAPIGFAIVAISMVYLIANVLRATDLENFFLISTGTLILFIVGAMVLVYSYDIIDRINNVLKRLVNNSKDASGLVFVIVAAILVVVSIVMGIYSLDTVYTYRDTQRIILFIANALWPFLFALMVYHFGAVLNGYLNEGYVRFGSIVGCLYIVGAGLLLTGIADFLLVYTDVYTGNNNDSIIEFVAGIVFIVLAVVIRSRLARASERQAE
ncbi:MAG: DUF373 family protein [Thermoplasmata archaeon]|nr:DUF373 family protein [Thermoplasmata archaeon]